MLAGYAQLLVAADRARWDAEAPALERDERAWRALHAGSRARLERLLAGFWVAEHGVAEQLEPFLPGAGGLARACLERQREDERRHARFFDRALRELAGIDPERDARCLAGEAIVELFEHRLQDTARELAGGRCSLAEAVALYHLVLEAIVLNSGQEALLALAGPLPVTADAVARVQRDERWHVGLGMTLLGEQASAPAGQDLDRLAASAATAWGGDWATRERALALHRRRVGLMGHGPGRAGAAGAREDA
jgi:ribonucleoside-diphosphate reductase beta chain